VSVWAARRPGIADVLTLANALCGAAAVLAVAGPGPFPAAAPDDRYRTAALLLVVGSLLDVVDGAAARRWGGTALGPHLDSLADAVTFGVAPPVAVLAVAVPSGSTADQAFVAAGAMAYTAAALVRLADFAARRRDDRNFVGLPTTSACISALSVGFLPLPPVGTALGLFGIALLMLSPLPYPAGSRRVGFAVTGWVLGALGIVGVLDVRVCAAAALVSLCVLVPLTTRSGSAAVASRAS
jgi:CDP-diacylglycerol--serine O-phosphatidyltransferase